MKYLFWIQAGVNQIIDMVMAIKQKSLLNSIVNTSVMSQTYIWACFFALTYIFSFSFFVKCLQDTLVIRKIHPCLPSFKSEFTASVPLTRIRDIAHRNDIPHDLKVGLFCLHNQLVANNILKSLFFYYPARDKTYYTE